METEQWFERILPHRPPALLVTGVSERSDRTISCSGMISSNHPSVSGGHAPVSMAVEFAAQASGLLLSSRESILVGDDSKPREGYLVSLKGVDFRAGSVPADQTLEVQVELQASFGEVAMFRFIVRIGDDPVALGRLGVAMSAGEDRR
jgi:predicted hotdog family 3-hydroxylacyl-ACP dehydratase